MPKHINNTNTYATVAEAIRFVQLHAHEQPSLEEIAAHVELSPSHLHRIFSEWAGITPKRFLQFLTKENARALLRQSRDVLSTAVESGLSGPGRLHDLMVSCEALTPGEIGALGEGLQIRFGFAGTPLGEIIVGTTPRGICHLRFIDDQVCSMAEQELRDEWPQAVFIRDDEIAQKLALRIFNPLAQAKPLSVLLKGTNFQIKVWEALLRIPSGYIASYGDLASMMNAPRAQRAVGSALAQNRVAVLVPCHRVIRESGELGQFRWGAERKHALQLREAANNTS